MVKDNMRIDRQSPIQRHGRADVVWRFDTHSIHAQWRPQWILPFDLNESAANSFAIVSAFAAIERGPTLLGVFAAGSFTFITRSKRVP